MVEFEPELQSGDVEGGKVEDGKNGKNRGCIGRDEVDGYQEIVRVMSALPT
jgi:hypothetical protein